MSEHFVHPYPPDVDEWLDLRAPYFNASMAGALFGIHPYETLADVCVQKLTHKRKPVTEAMERGNDVEPYIIDKLRDRISRPIVKPPELYGYGVCLASLDAIDLEDPEVHYEIKSTSEYIGTEPLPYWYAQVQMQMGCYGSRRAIIGYIDPRWKFDMFEIEFDEGYFDRLYARAEGVMACLALGELPEGMDLSAENVQDLWPSDDGETVVLPDANEALAVVCGYQESADVIKTWESRKRDCREQMVRWLGQHSVAMVDGEELYTFKQPKGSTKFDMESFARDHPDLVEQYTVPVPSSRRIYIKEAAVKRALLKRYPETEEEIL